jgi:hypothetical protein
VSVAALSFDLCSAGRLIAVVVPAAGGVVADGVVAVGLV